MKIEINCENLQEAINILEKINDDEDFHAEVEVCDCGDTLYFDTGKIEID